MNGTSNQDVLLKTLSLQLIVTKMNLPSLNAQNENVDAGHAALPSHVSNDWQSGETKDRISGSEPMKADSSIRGRLEEGKKSTERKSLYLHRCRI